MKENSMSSMSILWKGLSVRSINCLTNIIPYEILENITPESALDWVRKGISNGMIYPEKLRNYGWKSHREVCNWAGIKPPRRTPPKKVKLIATLNLPMKCPHCGKHSWHPYMLHSLKK